jgi:putative transposase
MAEYRHSAHATFDLKYHVIRITKYRYKILRGRRASARPDPTGVPGTQDGDHPRGSIAGPHPQAVVSTAASGAGQAGAIRQGPIIAKTARRISRITEAVSGTAPVWARGYFCAIVGAVDEQMIKAYIENHEWDEDEQGFKITAPTEP